MNKTDLKKYNQAVSLLDQNKFESAANILTDLDLTYDDRKVHIALVRALIGERHFFEAKKRINEQPAIFMGELAGAKLYFEVLIGLREFISARILLKKDIFEADKEFQTGALQQIVKLETIYQDKMQTSLKEYEKSFYHLGNETALNQIETLEKANFLPLDNFLRAVHFILQDPYLNQAARVSVLEILVQLQINQEFEFITYDNQTEIINPARLELIQDSELWKKINLNLNTKKIDISLINNLREQTFMYLNLVWPFQNQMFSNENDWINNVTQHLIHQVPNKLDILDKILMDLI